MTSSAITASPALDGYRFPLSSAQARLWILDQLVPGSITYNLCFATRLHQPVNAATLQRAIQTVVERHEILRTVFRVVDDEPAQIVLPSMPIRLAGYDLRRLPAAQAEAEAARLAARLGDQPFDLAKGPLLRAALIWLGPSEYALAMCLHHIVADGWSLGVLAGELGVLYEGGVLGGLGVQYADFAVWQREWLVGERLGGQVGFWRGVLGGLVELGLPLDRARPVVQAHRGAGFGFGFDGRVVGGLGVVGRSGGATLFMVLLAVWVAVLGRWCGQDDVVVGAPIAGRSRAELERLIGFFVNTLVLRVDVGGDPSFGELVGRVREVALGAYAHADVPFEKLVEELAPQRDLSRNPLFQVTFQLFESPSSPDAIAAQSQLEVPVTSSLFDIRVDVFPSGSGLAGRVEYDVELFEESSIRWLIDRFVWIAGQVAADPERRLSELDWIPPAHKELLAAFNATGAPIPDGCVPDHIAAQTTRTPERVAVADGDGAWTYRELGERADALASALHHAGVARGEVVAVYVPRGRAFVAAALGAMRAGGAYLPLDAAYPPARVAHILADGRPRALITTRALTDGLEIPAGTQVLCLDEWPPAAAAPEITISATDPAYVIYTSGSTGAPKGVIVGHASLMNLIAWHQHAYALTPEDHGSQISSVGFDAAVWELWPYLTTGAQIHVCDDDTRGDTTSLLTWLTDQQITVAFIPTPLAELLLTQPWPPTSQLRYLLTGGDTLRRWANPTHPYTLVNHYGPTEATVVTTATTIPTRPPPHTPQPPIGKPIRNTTIHILDHHGTPHGPGHPGELHISGPTLAHGYHHDPTLTHQRFTTTPTGTRLYKTGDIARWQPDGTLTFHGRTDTQIKIRGYRIEPQEIETLLTQHPHITHALITTQTTTTTPHLTAHITTNNASTTGAAVRRWLRDRVPAPMVPTAIAILDELPVTPNGKIDYDALPAAPVVDDGDEAPVAPTDVIEEALCRLWAEVLGAEVVGIRDDFFARGGHSLLATQLVSRIRGAFGFELPLRTLFEHPTVADVAAVLRRDAGSPPQVEGAAEALLQVLLLSDEDVEAMLERTDAAGGAPS